MFFYLWLPFRLVPEWQVLFRAENFAKKLPEQLFLSGERRGVAASVWCLGACWDLERLFEWSAPVFVG